MFCSDARNADPVFKIIIDKREDFMKRFILILFLFGCSARPIEEVQKGKVILMGQYFSVSQIIDALAGARGEVKWKTFRSDYKEVKNAVIVEVKITRGEKNYILQFLYNRERDIHELIYYEENGEPASLFDLLMHMWLGPIPGD